MAKGTMNQVLSAAIVRFTKLTDTYHRIYASYMGIEEDPPIHNVDDYPWPDEAEVLAHSVFSEHEGNLRVGCYPRSPYYFYEEGEENPIGFELEFLDKIVYLINQQYNVKLKPNWVTVEIPEEELPYDGTDVNVISSYLEEGLGVRYDMVMSGILTLAPPVEGEEAQSTPPSIANQQGGSPEEPLYEYCAQYSLFWVGALYSGKDGLTGIRTGNMETICQDLASISSRENPVIVTHTDSASDPAVEESQQTKCAFDLINGIIAAGGYSESMPLLVPQIIEAVEGATEDQESIVHAYVGDCVQIQRWAWLNEPVVDLEVNVLGKEMAFAPYTLPDW